MVNKEEKARKAQALEGKSYLLTNEENDRRKKPAENEGSEFIERRPNQEDVNYDQQEKVKYDKAKR